MYPTQSISRTRMTVWSERGTSAAFSGTNFGSVVIIVLPAADWGSSSVARSRKAPSSIRGSTSVSINRLIKVLLPVRTGPTTPM